MTEPGNWRKQILAELVPGLAPVTLAADPDRLLLDEDLLAAIRGRGFELFTWEDPVVFRLVHETRRRSLPDPRSAPWQGLEELEETAWGTGTIFGISGRPVSCESDSGGAELLRPAERQGVRSGHAGDGKGVSASASAELLLRFDRDDLGHVPYDLLQTGRPLRFNLSEVFRGLSHSVIASLDRSDLDTVYSARLTHGCRDLGKNATMDFVLRHVFGVRMAEIRRPADLLHVLLRRHCSRLRPPRLLDDRFVDRLRRNRAFDLWPLESIVPDREAFLSFLQERWAVFLDRVGQNEDPVLQQSAVRVARVAPRAVRRPSGKVLRGSRSGPVPDRERRRPRSDDAGRDARTLECSATFTTDCQEARARYDLRMDGPAHLPFDHVDVRAYVVNLFLEGRLAPVVQAGSIDPHDGAPVMIGERPDSAVPQTGTMDGHDGWISVGIRSDPEADRRRRLERLLAHIDGMIPRPGARRPDWLAFACTWAELAVLWWATQATAREELSGRLDNLRRRVDEAFLAWVESRYAGLHNQPPDPPAMVHHLPRYLARRLEDAQDEPTRKVALIVVDGLALDQWLVLRRVLECQRPALRFRSDAVFAWAPTITSVSRQALFAGRPPFHFESSIHTTENERSLWRRFWAEHDLKAHEVGYLKDRGNGGLGELRALRESISSPGLRALGLVVHKVDDIMHGMELGASGMLNQVRQWAEEGYPAALVDALLESGFVVFLTSDHGNIETRGFGRPAEGALVTTRGKRARLYSDAVLRDRVLEQFPDALAWPGPGLPDGCHALLAPGRSAFAPAGERTVGHGGISLEELVVPFIEIRETRARDACGR